MEKTLKVIVSHPARQANIYYRPRAAEQMGADVAFLTGLYYRPERLPYSLVRLLREGRKARVETLLEKRRLEGLSPNNVVSLMGPVLELTLRPMGRIREWFAIHDWLASRWISRRTDGDTKGTILHCFQDSCRRTLGAARGKNIVRLLEITLPPIVGAPVWGGCEERWSELDLDRLRAELREAQFVLVQSEFSVKSVEALGVPRERIIRCHLGVDTKYYRPRTGPRRPGPLRILFLGGASRRKGVHHLLEAWRQFGGTDAELLVSGNRVSNLESLPRDIANCRVVGRVPDSEFLSLLQSADILVHPSLAEGGCNVVYEALACGVPCIVSSNATSAVRHGVEGLVFPVGDVGGLTLALQRLCRESETRDKMSLAARARAESLGWERYLTNLGAIYAALGEFAGNRNPRSLDPIRASSF